MSQIVAELVDENTLEFQGVKFIREDEWEVLLRPIYSLEQGGSAMAPKMQCSNCGYSAGYWSWYKALKYKDRYVKYCPGCGKKVIGMVER